MPFEATHSDPDGRVVSFEVHPRFLADVIKRAGISPGKLQRAPPPGFVINQRVDYFCFLLMQQTETSKEGVVEPASRKNLATGQFHFRTAL
jgi:hypothetical protein